MYLNPMHEAICAKLTRASQNTVKTHQWGLVSGGRQPVALAVSAACDAADACSSQCSRILLDTGSAQPYHILFDCSRASNTADCITFCSRMALVVRARDLQAAAICAFRSRALQHQLLLAPLAATGQPQVPMWTGCKGAALRSSLSSLGAARRACSSCWTGSTGEQPPSDDSLNSSCRKESSAFHVEAQCSPLGHVMLVAGLNDGSSTH